jgi:hypothetical protein
MTTQNSAARSQMSEKMQLALVFQGEAWEVWSLNGFSFELWVACLGNDSSYLKCFAS